MKKMDRVASGFSPCIVLLLLLNFSVCSAFLSNCQREPEGVDVPRVPGDGGFYITLSGNPKKYVPGEVYIVSLKGQRSHFRSQKFTRFMLTVEATQLSSLHSLQSVGMFQLHGGVQTLHSEKCPNAIIEASNTHKNDIQVRWTAPPSGSGCLKFRAMVVDSNGQWFMDDGQLTKDLCEDIQQLDVESQIFSDCCACNEAKYEVTFEGFWSRQTHPKQFPANEWLTHFSDIIGASHSSDYKMWAPGELASDGLKQVAEWGSTRTLESELKRQSDQIRTIIKARGLWYPNVNGKTFAVFRVDNRHHLMSLVSMLGPSPDWVVGVSSLELCTKNCSWVDQKVLNMYPWDAGTDSGVTYMSANSPTIPRGKIRRITNASPNDHQSPFYDSNGNPMKPLAKLTITRQRIYEKSCSDDGFLPSYENDYDNEDDQNERPECMTTEWSPFTPCTRTCGKGLRQRTREYQIPLKADMFRCNVQLIEREMCAGFVPICEGGVINDMFGNERKGTFDPICETSQWSRWSPCSATCDEGLMMRSRRYINRMGRKKCVEPLTEKKPCIGTVATCPNEEEMQTTAECTMTPWSSWSICTATCGQGIRVRTRTFLVSTGTEQSCNVKTTDKIVCNGERDTCEIDHTEAREICLQPQVIGPCRGYFKRYFFDSTKRMCRQFIYGGCRGNRNNFDTYDECTKICEYSRDNLHALPNGTNFLPNNINQPSDGGYPNQGTDSNRWNNRKENENRGQNNYGGLRAENQLGLSVDCVMSDWSEWSQWTNGWRESTRYVQTEPKNNGQKCPKKLVRRRKCKLPKCQSNMRHQLQSMSFVFDPYLEYSSPILPSANQFQQMNSLNQDRDRKSENYLDQQEEDVNCELGDWAPWSPCTQTCGRDSLQQRSRSIIVKSRGRGTLCGPTLERRFCSLPPCRRRVIFGN